MRAAAIHTLDIKKVSASPIQFVFVIISFSPFGLAISEIHTRCVPKNTLFLNYYILRSSYYHIPPPAFQQKPYRFTFTSSAPVTFVILQPRLRTRNLEKYLVRDRSSSSRRGAKSVIRSRSEGEKERIESARREPRGRSHGRNRSQQRHNEERERARNVPREGFTCIALTMTTAGLVKGAEVVRRFGCVVRG